MASSLLTCSRAKFGLRIHDVSHEPRRLHQILPRHERWWHVSKRRGPVPVSSSFPAWLSAILYSVQVFNYANDGRPGLTTLSGTTNVTLSNLPVPAVPALLVNLPPALYRREHE